ncbi:hypothetical protein P8452_72149 [Trifolium repens]|nr:hypothetical protein P8452_72149 [Trifolium repens]
MYQQSPSRRTSAISIAGVHQQSPPPSLGTTTIFILHHWPPLPPPSSSKICVVVCSLLRRPLIVSTTWIWRHRHGSDSNTDDGDVVTTKVENGSTIVNVVV